MKIALFVAGLTIVAGGFWLVNTSRAASETPEYEVVRKDGAFEIRDYPSLVIASTAMSGTGMDDSFGQLFRYITGTNEASEKIAMTAPVLIDGGEGKRTMSFIMPKDTVQKGVPKPSGEKVTLGKVDSARLATMRFSGGRSAETEKEAEGKLMEWLETQKLKPQGRPIFAYYDPPWTPLFMRRNEVMVRIADHRQ
jgi:hypothetical protein